MVGTGSGVGGFEAGVGEGDAVEGGCVFCGWADGGGGGVGYVMRVGEWMGWCVVRLWCGACEVHSLCSRDVMGRGVGERDKMASGWVGERLRWWELRVGAMMDVCGGGDGDGVMVE